MHHHPWNLTSLRAVVVLAVATTFAASLTQIAFVVDGVDRSIERLPFYGLDLLITGWLSVFDPFKFLLWLANPMIVVASTFYLRGVCPQR